MTLLVQVAINCDVPGMRTITYNGGSSGSVTVTGHMVVEDWLDAISTALQAAGVDYTWFYDTAADRIRARRNSGASYGFDVESASMRDLLGMTSTADWNTPATAHTAIDAPDCIVPILGAQQTTSESARRVIRRDYAPRRARHIAWGEGEIHRVRVRCTLAQAERLAAGPCMGGRVRIGDSAAAGRMTAAEPAGWIEGTIHDVQRVRTEGQTEALALLDYAIHHAEDAATPADFDAVWGSIARNYALVAYARVEGLPYVFTERALDLVSASHDESATLILPDETGITYSIDRSNGSAGCNALRLGILDPDNDLAIFGPPTLRAELTVDLAFDDTAIDVDSTSGWPASGALWIGKERIEYGGTSGGTQFTTLTREDWGPAYSFRAAAPLSWNVCTDVPVFWQGRLVELWVAVVDCYGRPVASAWDDAYTRMVWSGTVRTRPAYEAGAWVLDCESLAERLAREPGAELLGQCDVYNQLVSAVDGPLVIVPSDAECEYLLTDGAGTVEAGRFALSAASLGGSEGSLTGHSAVSYKALVSGVLGKARALWQDAALQVNDVQPYCTGIEATGDGAWRAVISAPSVGTSVGDGTWQIGPITGPSGLLPEWSKPIVISKETLPLAYTGFTAGALGWASGQFDTGMDGRTCYGCVLRASDDSEALTSGDWPTGGGFLVISGAFGDEVASYTAGKTTNGRTYLYGMSRGLRSTPRADVTSPGVEVRGYAQFAGTLGVQIATLLQSSGYGDRGTYDTESQGYGLSLDWVDESTLAAAGGGVAYESAADLASPAVETYGGALASLGLAFAPIRSATASNPRLRWGVRSVDPFGPSDVALRDADLRSDAVPQLPANGLLPTPNIVKLTPVELGGVQYAGVRVVLAESLVSEGAREEEYELPWTDSALGALMLQAQAQQTIAARAAALAYTLQVTPCRDWLTGQIVDIDVTHPGFFDPATGATGLNARGVIVETSRRMSGECSITVLIRRDDIQAGPLCPSARVTAVDVGAKEITVNAVQLPDGKAIWEDDADVLLYHAGVASRYDVERIAGVSGFVLTLNAFPAWLDSTAVATGAVYVTYPDTGATYTTSLQLEHVHYDDGSQWL